MLLRQNAADDPKVESRAVSLLEAAIARDPSLAEPHFQLGSLWLRKGKAAAALVELEQAGKLDPKDSKIHFALSRAYRHLGRREQAATELALYEKLKAQGKKVD